MKSKALLCSFHCYTPFGRKFYQPILDNFTEMLFRYRNEFDTVYLLDSQWGIEPIADWVKVIVTNPSLRYYDAYKEVVPMVKEDMVLFVDNDMFIYRTRVIFEAFEWLKKYDVASIYDTIGEKHYLKLGGQSKFCPYFFATRTETLKKFINCEWGPKMPEHETLGELTQKMLEAGLRPKEIEEDKSDFLFGTELGERRSKNLGYYHIRAGSTPAYLLAHRERGDSQYFDYIKNQPKSEYLRQLAWYWIMGGNKFINIQLLTEIGENYGDWFKYIENFRIFHGLK
jgi:hypothetical protein